MECPLQGSLNPIALTDLGPVPADEGHRHRTAAATGPCSSMSDTAEDTTGEECTEGERNGRLAGTQVGPGEVGASQEEGRQIGQVKWAIYGRYIAAAGPLLTTLILSGLILMQVALKTRCSLRCSPLL